jgi:hypothetical protein
MGHKENEWYEIDVEEFMEGVEAPVGEIVKVETV